MNFSFRVAAPLAAAFIITSTIFVSWNALADSPGNDAVIERGRYIARIAGCNDCHTPGYAQTGGKVDEKLWLIGDQVGWQGAWGTTYPANLRLSLAKLSEDEWVRLARSAQYRPPMPWFALRDMSEPDLRALHRFVRSLGARGEPAPGYVPPGQVAHGPVIAFPAMPEQ
jgi:mono/diheme cytochrome c family protein